MHCQAAVDEDECTPRLSAEGDGEGLLKKRVRVHLGHRYAIISLRHFVAQTKMLGIPTQYFRQIVRGLVNALLAKASCRLTHGARISSQVTTPDQRNDQAGNSQAYDQPARRHSELEGARPTRNFQLACLM